MVEEVGGFLRQLRTVQRRSVSQVAKAAGISKRTLTYWEANTYQPRLPELEAVLKTLQATPAERTQALGLMTVPRALQHLHQESDLPRLERRLGPMPSRSDLLRALRLRRGMYLEQLAPTLGVSTATLSRWENGKVRPEAEQFERLLAVLDAHPQEQVALRNSSLFTDAGLNAENSQSLRGVWESYLQFQQGLWQHMEDALNDLHFLTFAAQAWRLATRHERARLLLSEIYSNHAAYLAGFKRYKEASHKAEGALNLLEKEETHCSFALRAVLVSAQGAVYGSLNPRPHAGIHRLQNWEGCAHDLDIQAWLLAERAEYLALAGHNEMAVRLSQQACEMAEKGGTGELLQRQRDLARLLLQVEKPVEALEVAMRLPLDVPFWRTRTCLIRAEALLMLKERSAAQVWLESALSDIDAYALEHLRAKADGLARQL